MTPITRILREALLECGAAAPLYARRSRPAILNPRLSTEEQTESAELTKS